MNGTFTDLTVEVSEIGMYSYDRPAWVFWNAFANRLMKMGYSQEDALEILKSKHTRWMLDSKGEDALERVAERLAADYVAKNENDIKRDFPQRTCKACGQPRSKR